MSSLSKGALRMARERIAVYVEGKCPGDVFGLSVVMYVEPLKPPVATDEP